MHPGVLQTRSLRSNNGVYTKPDGWNILAFPASDQNKHVLHICKRTPPIITSANRAQNVLIKIPSVGLEQR